MGAVVGDGQGRLLLIRRGHPPGEGLWSLPGGRVETGESDAAAVARELREETGLSVEIGELIGEGTADIQKMIIGRRLLEEYKRP